MIGCWVYIYHDRFSEGSPRGFEGELEINSVLRQAKLLFPGELVQPEAFEKDKEGKTLCSVIHSV